MTTTDRIDRAQGEVIAQCAALAVESEEILTTESAKRMASQAQRIAEAFLQLAILIGGTAGFT